MSISYKPLWKLLIDKDMKKKDLQGAAKISPSLMQKLNKDQSVTTTTLTRICKALDCRIEDVIEIVHDDND